MKLNKKEKQKEKLKQELYQLRNRVENVKYKLGELGIKESRIEYKNQFIWGTVFITLGIMLILLWGTGIINGQLLISWIPGIYAISIIAIGSAAIMGSLRST